MLYTLILSAGLVAASLAASCVDGQNNVITLADINDAALDIHLIGVQIATYDSKGNPSCNNGKPKLWLPGIVKPVAGQIFVSAANDLSTVNGLLTITKDSWLIGSLCKQGKSANALVPNDVCSLSLSNITGPALQSILETPGTYDLKDLQEQSGFDGVLNLPPPPAALEAFIEGNWKGEILAQNGAQKTITNIKLPGDTEWIYVEH